MLPALIVLAGLGLAWSQLDAVQRGRLRDRAGGRTPVSVLRLAGGIAARRRRGAPVRRAGVGQGVEAGDAGAVDRRRASPCSAGVALVLAPVVAAAGPRARRRAGRPRARVRARRHRRPPARLGAADARADPVAGRRLRRGRPAWRAPRSASCASGSTTTARRRARRSRPRCAAIVAEVEDSRSGPAGDAVAIESVVVGDRVPDADTEALLQATREALVNAVVHGRPPVSLYLEVGATTRSRCSCGTTATGSTSTRCGTDRFGVRESIIGRVRRRGGTATVHEQPGARDRGAPGGADPVPRTEQRSAVMSESDGHGRRRARRRPPHVPDRA